MARFESFKNISQGIFYWLLLAVIIVLVAWIILSTVGNFVLDRQAGPKAPDVEDARYAIVIPATGQVIYAGDYSVNLTRAGHKVYTLSGYYELQGDKWVYNGGNIPINEYYVGKIDVIVRR